MIRLALVGVLAAVLGSCSVNQYCLNCETNDGGHDDGMGSGSGSDGGGSGSGTDGGPCVPTGVEVCDGKDNDCNGLIDDNIADVGQPAPNQMGECAGGKITCVNGVTGSTKPPMPEICDMKDNNCNGTVDEGDPGGGAACGTNVGECTAGVNHCDPATGTIKCYGAIGTVGGQPELCNGRDDDCDGNFDEGIASLGSCGGGPGVDPNAGECQQGQLMCVGGGTVCMGDQGPVFEICDNLDNDCDGVVDNGFDKKHDPQNCGACGNVCSAPHATSGCAPTGAAPGGACNIASCQPGFHDNNGNIGDGCEYACLADGAEVCDGVDNDCDGNVDNGLTPPPNLCKTAGACAGSFAMCTGSGGWKCVYPSGNVSLDANGNIVPETVCDGIDNDCNGIKDDAQPNLGQACHDAGIGECQNAGVFVCPGGAHTGAAVCDKSVHVGVSPSPEQCDGKDNDCNGLVDDGAAAGTLPGQEWVAIPNSTVKIMKYEASRPDASATGQGISTATTCSRAGVIPWTNVKYPDAVTACTNVGGRLCTEAEWQQMCEGIESYPQTAPTGSDVLMIQAEDAFAFAPGTSTGGTAATRNWTVDTTTTGYSGRSAMQALPDTGANITQPNAPSQSPRMDFKIDFGATAANYYVYVRMYSNDGNSDTIWVAVNPTTPGTVTTNRLTSAVNNAWNWVRSDQLTNVSGVQTVSVYMREDGVRVDEIAITQVTAQVPDDPNTWSYKTNHHIGQATTCNSNEFDTDTATAGDQDDIIKTGSMAACYADGGGVNDAFDMSGNVKEWTKARAAGQNPIRGGASNNDVTGTTCELNFTLADNAFFFPNVGFRCCK